MPKNSIVKVCEGLTKPTNFKILLCIEKITLSTFVKIIGDLSSGLGLGDVMELTIPTF